MTTINDTKHALNDLRRELAILDGEYLSIGSDLGDALARVRTGDTKAQTAANKASKRRQELAQERDRLRLEESALLGQLHELEAEEAEREAAGALPAFEEIDEEVRELQRQYTETIRTAAEIGQKLMTLQEPWYAAIRTANAHGHRLEVEGSDWKYPSHLLPQGVLKDPEERIRIWLGPSSMRWYRENIHKPHISRFKVGTENASGQDRVVQTITVSAESMGEAPGGFLGRSVGLVDAVRGMFPGASSAEGARLPGTSSGAKSAPAARPSGELEKRDDVA